MMGPTRAPSSRRPAHPGAGCVPARWRTQATRLQSIAVEVCWRPFDGKVAGDFSDFVDLHDGHRKALSPPRSAPLCSATVCQANK